MKNGFKKMNEALKIKAEAAAAGGNYCRLFVTGGKIEGRGSSDEDGFVGNTAALTDSSLH
jgi:hypothetical protein